VAVKKGILDSFLKPSSHYNDNQKSLRSIFIDKDETDLKPEAQNLNFLESSFSTASKESLQEKYNGKTEPNLSQSEAKVRSNLSQSEAKVGPIGWADTEKLEPITEPNLSQTRVKLRTNLSQSEAKVEPNMSFSRLIGLQRKIVLFIHEACLSILDQQTHPLSIEFISNQCHSPKSAVRKAIQRLEQKGVIYRTDFKNGRGGWTRYQLSDQIYQEILRLKNYKVEPNLSQSWDKHELNLSQTKVKVGTEPETELRPTTSSSSSNLLNKTTTEFPDEWNFDISPYAKFGFTRSNIKQLISSGAISASMAEQSLIEFSYDSDNNALPAIKTNKINFLMGLLRLGHAYVSGGFKNEQEAAISEMARRAEDKRKKLLEEKFTSWEANLSDEEIKEIEIRLPVSLMVLYRAHGISNTEVRNWLFNYYLNRS